MAVHALTDIGVYVSGYDFTTDTNNAQLKVDVEQKDATTFGGNGYRTVIGGLKSIAFDHSGFWQSATDQAVDPQAFPKLATVDEVFTVSPQHTEPASPASLLAAERAYMFRASKLHYELGGTIGDVAPFALQSMGSNGVGVVNGVLVRKRANVSATGQLGATFDNLGLGVGATQALYATLHVFTAGTTVTVQLQTDDNTGFSSPTTIATIGPITTSSAVWTSVSGAIADRYARFNVSAITGTFSVAGAIGIK